MKKICIALLASLACLFVVSCERQEDDATLYSANKFRVEAPQFIDENGQKVYLHYTDMASTLIYEEGDKVYINGHSFTLVQDGGWCAVSDDGNPISGKRFLVAYADGTVSEFDSTSGTYHYNLNAYLGSDQHNKIVLGGVAENNDDYVITLKPACAILRINSRGAGGSWSNVKVGFDANKIPKNGTVNVSNRNINASEYMNGVERDGGGNITGDFLYMRYSNPSVTGEGDYWYVAIPISGSSVTTTLYLEWNNGSETIQHKTQGEVTLQKGYVYTLGTERQSPFYANGSSKSYFQVSSSLQVRFSAGNLQYTRYEDPGTGEMSGKWRFSEHQYDMIQDNNSNIGNYYTGWIDLYCWGTSGWNSGGGATYEPYMTSGTFKPGGSNDADLLGDYANADWGVFNSANIYYGSSRSGLTSWRTLTNDEWDYLLTERPSAASKYALATVGTSQGLVLLPESWTLPAGCSFTAGTGSGYSTNSYTLEQWDLMETAGAIFLPSAGKRNGTTVSETPGSGYYWSATHATSMNCNAMKFTSSSVSASVATSRATGCAVRLVKNR